LNFNQIVKHELMIMGVQQLCSMEVWNDFSWGITVLWWNKKNMKKTRRKQPLLGMQLSLKSAVLVFSVTQHFHAIPVFWLPSN
jgi:hypothetical protein